MKVVSNRLVDNLSSVSPISREARLGSTDGGVRADSYALSNTTAATLPGRPTFPVTSTPTTDTSTGTRSILPAAEPIPWPWKPDELGIAPNPKLSPTTVTHVKVADLGRMSERDIAALKLDRDRIATMDPSAEIETPPGWPTWSPDRSSTEDHIKDLERSEVDTYNAVAGYLWNDGAKIADLRAEFAHDDVDVLSAFRERYGNVPSLSTLGIGTGVHFTIAEALDNSHNSYTALNIGSQPARAFDAIMRSLPTKGVNRAVQGSAFDLPFPNSTFDLAVDDGCDAFAPGTDATRNKAIDEAARVLKPGGEFVSFVSPSNTPKAFIDRLHQHFDLVSYKELSSADTGTGVFDDVGNARMYMLFLKKR